MTARIPTDPDKTLDTLSFPALRRIIELSEPRKKSESMTIKRRLIRRLGVLTVMAVFMLAFSMAAPNANASDIEQPGRFGLGLSIGWPGPAISTNTFVADWMSIQADVGALWSFRGVFLSADYLFWLHDIVDHEKLDFTWFVGPGLVFAYWDNRYYWRNDRRGDGYLIGAVKAAIGLALQFKEQPFDLVFQVAPGVMFSEFGAGLWMQGGVAFRYYF